MLDPYRFIKANAQIEREIELMNEGRMAGLLAEPSHLNLSLEVSEQSGRGVLSGRITGALRRQCQVCLESLSETIDIDFAVLPVPSIEAAEELSEEFEPLVVDDEGIVLEELVADEVILAIRSHTSHEELTGVACKPAEAFTAGEIPVEKKASPFEVLKSVKLK